MKVRAGQYRLSVLNAFGTLIERVGYYTGFPHALSHCSDLAKQTLNPDFIEECPLSEWQIEGNLATQLLKPEGTLQEISLCVAYLTDKEATA